jgi:hypothetical protein
VSVDGGPGIGDVARALEDGVSLEGSLGIGLGSVRRLSDAHSPRAETVAASHGGWVVIASDGISDRWRSDEHGALAERHPLVLAAVLMRDFSRVHDDATVLVAATK